MESARVTGFLPSTSGFKFQNRFPVGCPVVTVAIPGIGSFPIGDASNGLCNGMVYAAMDLFLASPHLLPPATTAVPVCGTPMIDYIKARLIDAFALPMGPLSNAYRYIDF